MSSSQSDDKNIPQPLEAGEPVVLPPQSGRTRQRRLIVKTAAAAFVGLGIGIVLMGNHNRELAGLNQTLEERNEKLTAFLAGETGQRKKAEQLAIEARQQRSQAEQWAAEEQKQRTKAELQEALANAAADAERQAKEEAQTERDRAKMVTKTLVSAFRRPDPELDGRTMTVAEVLDRAAKELPEEHKNQPLTLAALLHAVGRSFVCLGLPKEALPILEKARDLRRDHRGPDHTETLKSQSSLAYAYGKADRFAEAISLFEQTLKARTTKLGPDHAETLKSQNDLAICYVRTDRLAEAIPLFEQTIKARTANLGPDHADTLNTQANLAYAYGKADRQAEAIALYEQTLKAQKAKLGPDDAKTLHSQANLAYAYGKVGRLAEAIALYEQSLKARHSQAGSGPFRYAQKPGRPRMVLRESRAARRSDFPP